MVEIKPHYGKNMATGVTEYLGQHRVFLDGWSVGFIGDRPNAKLILTAKLDPDAAAEVMAAVAEHAQRTPEKSVVPDVPHELLEEDDDIGDIDEG